MCCFTRHTSDARYRMSYMCKVNSNLIGSSGFRCNRKVKEIEISEHLILRYRMFSLFCYGNFFPILFAPPQVCISPPSFSLNSPQTTAHILHTMIRPGNVLFIAWLVRADYLRKAKEATGLAIVTEVMSDRDVELVAEYADCMQVGARNMQNFALLKSLGACGRPVLLKRGMSSTIKELLMSAEYIVAHGNPNVILCERGIRTFETATRNTCDITSVPVLNELTHLPVVLDPSHATGKRSLVPALARAAVAIGADGLIVEVHPFPEKAVSDGAQFVLLWSPSIPPTGRRGM